MSNCIKITYYKIEGGDQKMVTLPSIYLPEGTDFGTDSETESYVIESLLKIAKDPSHESYLQVQNMLMSEVVSTTIKKEIGKTADSGVGSQLDVPLSHAAEIAMSLPGSLVRNSGDIKNILLKRQTANLKTSLNLLKKLLNNTDVNIVFSTNSFDSNGKHLPETLNSVQGLYFQKENTIVVKLPDTLELESNDQLDYILSTDENVQESLIHELAHYHTVANLDNILINDIDRIIDFNTPQGNVGVENIVKSFTGLSKADKAKEFVAYYISNTDFRNAVNDKEPDFVNKFIGTLHKVSGSEHLASLLNLISTKQNRTILLERESPNNTSPLIEQDKLSENDGEDNITLETQTEIEEDVSDIDRYLHKVSITSKNYTRSGVANDPNTAYVFTENLHSVTAFPNRSGGGSALIRGLPNAYPIITKKIYDYNTRENVDFNNSDEDFEIFKKSNTDAINVLKNSGKPIVFPQGFGTDKAKMPTRFAEWLKDELFNNFGLITELNVSKTGLISKSIDNAIEGPDTTNTLMRSAPSGQTFLTITPIKISTPEAAKTHAKSIYGVFKNATDSSNKSIKYTMNYGTAVTAAGYNRAMLHKLQQNDIVRIPINSKNKEGEWVVSDRSTYLPIINSYIDGKTKSLKLQVATKNGKTLVVDADDVIAYRKFLGNLNIDKVNTPKGEIAETWANYANMTFGGEYTFNGQKINLPEVPKLYEKMTLRNNNFDTKIYDNEVATYVSFNIDKRFNQLANEKLREGDTLNVYTGRDDTYDNTNFENLKRNDVVKIVSKDKTGKKLTYYTPILNVYGDTIEVISSPGESSNLDNLKTHFVNKNNIAGVYMLRQNHDDMLSTLEDTLKNITDDGINQTTGLTKTSFLNYTPKGELSTSPNWNDLDAITNNDEDFFDNYTKWRSSLTDQEYNSLRENNLDQDTIKMLRYARAIDRRRSITDKLGVGGIVQLETVRWTNNPTYTEGAVENHEYTDKETGQLKTVSRKVPKWIKDKEKGFRTVNGVVLSKNGDWLKVRIAKQSFSDGKPVSGEYNYETVSVKVTNNHPSLNDRSSNNYAIRAVFKNNIKHVPLVNYFKNLRNTIRTNFENFNSLINHYNNTANNKIDLNPDSNEFALFGIREVGKDYRMNKTANGYVPNAIKSMSDLYDIRLFDEDVTADEKLRSMARLKVGSIVLTKIDDPSSKFPYGTAIVVDFDNRTGKPIIGYAFIPKYKSQGSAIDFNSRPEAYATKSVHPSEIVGVGYAKATHTVENENIIEMDDFINNDNYKRAEMYISSKKLFTYNTLEEANKKLNPLIKYGAKILEVYTSADGKRTTDKTKTSDTPITKYAVVFENTSKKTGKVYNVDTNSPYTDVWASAFENKPTKTILSALRPGDVLLEEYEKDGKTKYVDLVVDDIKGNLVYVTSYYPKKGTSGDELNDLDNYEQYPKVMLMKPETGLGLPGIRNIKLNYYKQNGENDVKVRKNLITNAETANVDAKPSSDYNRKKPESYNPNVVQGGSRTTTAKSLPKVKSNTQSNDSGADMSAYLSKASDFKAPSNNDVEGIKQLSNRLSEVYGVPVENLDSAEIHERFGKEYPNYNISKQRAFLKEGVIYINTDYATLAEPIHEMSHLVIQGLELTNPTYYNTVMGKMQSHPFYEKVKSYYPELDEKQLREETFVTVVGEHYFNSPDNGKTKDWENVNRNFFSNLFRNIRNFFAKLFGIEDHKFFRLNETDLMNSSFNDLLNNFNNRLLNGKFKTEVNLATDKMNHLVNGTYLKNASGLKSSLYLNLLESGFDDKFASDSWINTKNSTFVNWHNDEIVTASDGEPQIFYRTGNPFEVTTDDVTGNGDIVFVKGNITPTESGSFLMDSVENAKSVYSMNIEDSPNMEVKTIEEYATSKGYPMIGGAKDVAKTISHLREQFGDYNFTSYSLNDDSLFFVKYYKSPSENVLKLRNQLFSKNLIEATC